MIGIAAIVVCAALPASAQVCKEPGTSGTTALACDMTYRDTRLTCLDTYDAKDKDGRTVTLPTQFPACPAEPAPMKDTPRLSFIKDFSPYLYDFVRDPEDASKPYSGDVTRGTTGDATQTFATIGTAPEGVTRQRGCINQIEVEGLEDPADRAKLIRLQLDNCANQFILNSAMYPFHKVGSELSCATDADPLRRCAQEDMCQPLRMTEDPKQEYLASTYIEAAWKKLLNDPSYRLRDGKAPKEPKLPDNLELKSPIAVPTIPQVRINALAATPYEEIIDPSHPFSPRWDYEANERDKYSPMTASYGGDPQNAVFCAGSKDKVYKVDILTFRDEKLKFDDKITDRIQYNAACKANSGLQANPCCKVKVNGPNPANWTCTLKPCAECYGMTAQKPVCATDYTYTPDRAKVKSKYLPVHPALRFASAAQSMKSLSLSNIPSNFSVAEVSAALRSNVALLNALPINMPLSQALPLLNGSLNILQSLPAGFNLNQLGSLMAAPGQLLSQLSQLNPNMGFSQIQGMLNGQLGVLNGMTGSLPVGQALSTVTAMQGMLSGMGPNMLMSQAQSLFPQQMSIVNSVGSMSVNRAMILYNSHIARTTDLPSTIEVKAAIRQLQGVAGAANTVSMLSSLPPGMMMGDVNAILRGQLAGLGRLDPNASMSTFANALGGQINSMLNLPGNLNVRDVAGMMGSLQGTLGSLNPSTLMSQISGPLGSQIGSLLQLPGGFNVSQVSGMLNAQIGLLKGLPAGFNLSQLQGLMGSQLGQLNSLAGNLPVGQISNLMSGQLGQLSSFAGNTPIGQVSSAIDGNMFGSGGPVSQIKNGELPYLLVQATYYSRTAKCNPNEFGDANSDKMATLCKDLRAPLTPINKLKMRYHNPGGDAANIVLKEGVQEGLSFNDYFKDPLNQIGHMPYMRQWDTGRSIQKNPSTDQDPMDIEGQYTAIVGVGREAAPDSVNQGREEKDKVTDQRCLYGGWGDSTSIGALRINVPDPITSWTELKLYQAYTTRETNIICLGRYEKAFKHRSTENQMLTASGGIRTGIVKTECDADERGRPIMTSCKRYDISDEEAAAAGGPTAAGGVVSGSKWTSLQYDQVALPLAWRGYLSAKNDAKRFPNLAGAAGLITGLDKAQCGDFILMPEGGGETGSTRGLPKLARVKCSQNEASQSGKSAVRDGRFVEVEEADNGKWPDVCGTTNMMGELKTRRIYKPGTMRPETTKALEKLKWTTSCEDTMLAECEMKPWNSLKLYRPVDHVVSGNDGSEVTTP